MGCGRRRADGAVGCGRGQKRRGGGERLKRVTGGEGKESCGEGSKGEEGKYMEERALGYLS